VLAEWPAQPGELPANWLAAAAGQVRAHLASGDASRALAAARTLEAQVGPLLAAGSLQPEEEAQLRLRLGQALLAAGDPAAARPELERAVDLRRTLDVPGSPWLAEAEAALARCSEAA
jgi:Tfp pilus assembly protein PilF